jgi:predicted AAA+ superfamily ATPase
VSALLEASKELNCNELIIINWELEKTEIINDKTIKYIPAWKYLLE